MAVGYKQLNVLMYRNQASLGTELTSLGITDSTAVMDGYAVDFLPEFTPLDLATGTFGQQRQVRGAASTDIKVSLPINPTGGTGASLVDPFFLSSGMGVTTSTNLKTYTPSSDTTGVWKDMSLWSYTGEKTSGATYLTKTHSAMFDWELTGELGKPVMVNFTGKGAVSGDVTSASYPTGVVTIPSTVIPATIKATSMTVAGKAMKLLSFSLSIGNTVSLVKDMSSTWGYSGATITNRESNWKAKAYSQSAASLSPFPVMTSDTAAALSDFSVTFGPVAGSRITVSSGTNKSQVTKVTQSEEDGINIFDMEGIFVDNDFSVAINVT